MTRLGQRLKAVRIPTLRGLLIAACLGSALGLGFGHLAARWIAEPAAARPVPAELAGACLRVRADQPDGRQFLGCCAVLDAQTVLTAAHVLGEAAEVLVEAPTRWGTIWIPARVIKRDNARDLALLLLLTETNAPSCKLAAPSTVTERDRLLIVGSPAGARPACTEGFLASKSSDTPQPWLWQASNVVYGGNSGGPVFHLASRRLVGILLAASAPNACYFAGPVDLKDFLER